MRNLLPVCAGMVVVSGIVSANLWLELRAERQLNADLLAQMAEGRYPDRGPLLPAQPADEHADDGPQLAAPAPATLAASDKSDSPPAMAVQTGGIIQAGSNAALQNAVNIEKDLLKDPEYRKARLAQARMTLPQSYPGVVEELGLSAREADQLFDLLAEQQLSTSGILTLTASSDPAEQQAMIAEMTKNREASQRKLDEALVALLGDTKYRQWQDYQQTRGPRMQAVSLGSTLASAGQPLNDAQLRSLTAAFVGEQKRQREDLQTLARNNAGPMTPESQAILLETSMKRQEESNRRILDTAASHLSSQQLATLRAQFEQQEAMRRASARVQRERAEVQGLPGQAAGAQIFISSPVVLSSPVFIP